MKNKIEKHKTLIISLILVVGFVALIYSISRIERAVEVVVDSPDINVESPDISFGRSIQNETFLLNAQTQNVASVQMTEDDNVIAYLDNGGQRASLSVNDVVSFASFSSVSLPAPLVHDTYYYVTVASNSGFEIALTKGGSTIDITADSTGGEKFFEEITTIPLKTVDFRHITIWLEFEAQPSGSFKLVGSTSDTEPDWYEQQSTSNSAIYENIGMYDLEDAALIPGDTGLSFTGTDDKRMFTVNTDEIAWIAFKSSNFASGNLNFKATLGD